MKLTDRSRTIFVLLLSLLGTAALFLSFAGDVSPWKASRGLWGWWGPPSWTGWEVAMLGIPFLLSIPILIWQARRLIVDRLTIGEIAAAYVVSTAAMLSTAVSLGMLTFFLVREPPESGNEFYKFTVLVVACWLLLIANVLLILRNRWARLSREARAESFLLGGYLPNAILCLVMFYPQEQLFSSGLQVGAYLIAIVSTGYVVSIVLALRTERRPSVAVPAT